MILISGADLVLPDRVLAGASLTLEGDRIVEIATTERDAGGGVHLHFPNHYVVPGFIDVHVHGIEGTDALDGGAAIARMAERLTRYGVTAFCPTSIACDPAALRQMLAGVRLARTTRPPGGARVLPAHLESNFINPDYKGAQPLSCLRHPRTRTGSNRGQTGVRPGSDRGQTPFSKPSQFDANRNNQLEYGLGTVGNPQVPERGQTGVRPGSDPGLTPPPQVRPGGGGGGFSADEIMDEIAAARPDVGIVTVAPELDGAIALIEELVSHGHHVSLGHSGATYDQAVAAIRAGARQATHLFNRMPPLGHRVPGLAGAILESDEVFAELICDGVHVHPAIMRMALAAKRPERIMAITDGTAGSGLPVGTRTTLGGYPITVRDAAYLDDGTIAGSALTMDKAFARLVSEVGLSLPDAATVCATTPARALGLQGFGIVAPGAVADLTILDRDLTVVQTWVAGTLAWEAPSKSTV